MMNFLMQLNTCVGHSYFSLKQKTMATILRELTISQISENIRALNKTDSLKLRAFVQEKYSSTRKIRCRCYLFTQLSPT